jgi:hypothetical protein
MKLVKLLFAAALIVMLAAPAWTACPVHPNPGVYSTYAGTLLPGRDSEAWCTGIGPGRPGNTDNAQSWNGVALGTQWKVWGMQIDQNGGVETARNVDAFGNGWIQYQTNYLGGQFWLSKNHTWSDGINDLTGNITYFNASTRITLVGGAIKGATSNIYFTGVFNECPLCTLEYVISNAMLVWMPGWPNMPSGYPPLECGASLAELYNVCCIQASIYCPVATGQSTWGAIKELYR